MRILIKTSTLFNYFILISLLIAFYYNAYRYPLQINAASTSPTYSATPFIMKAAKYIIFAVLYAIIVFFKSTSFKSISFGNTTNYIKTTIALVLSLFPLFWGINTRSISIIETGFFFFIAVIIHLYYHYRPNFNQVSIILKWTVYIALLYNLVQIVLFVLIGRLPALAYPNSISVRFGSFLDDPNGFGLLIPLFIGFSYYYFKGVKKLFIVFLLMLNLLLTQSLTAVGALGLAITISMILFVAYKFTLGKQILWIILSVLAVVFAIFAAFYKEIIEALTLFMMLKAGSIEGHAEGFEVIYDSNLLNYMGVLPLNTFSEMGYVNITTNFGVLFTLLYLLYGFMALVKYFLIVYGTPNVSHETKSIAYGAFLFILSFYIGMMNLPLEQVFPLNVICALFLGIGNTNLLGNSYPQREQS